MITQTIFLDRPSRVETMVAGYRASAGRTGLVRRGRADVVASRRGLTLGAVLLTPVAAVLVGDVATHPNRLAIYGRAGEGMLAVYLPYGVPILLALAAYATLNWRRKFLATALLLGPLTLVRPSVALGGAVAAAWASHDVAATVLALAAAAAVLAVEPLTGRRWYTPAPAVDEHGKSAGPEVRRSLPWRGILARRGAERVSTRSLRRR